MRNPLMMLCCGFAIAAGCSDDGTSPPPPPIPAAVSAMGNFQSGTVGTALAAPIGVRAVDQDSNPLPGVAVSFAVTAGGGSVAAASVTTNDQGEAATTWTLGPRAGTNSNTATASVSGLAGTPVVFTASANAGSPTQVSASAGNAQTAEVGVRVAQAPTVRVQDANNNPVAAVTVYWTVMGGGGSVAAWTSITDASGEASIDWTLGPVVGADLQMLRASAAGVYGTFSASAVLTVGTIAINAGDNQSAVAGGLVAVEPSVLVMTPGPGGVPVQGVVVDWAITAGGGSLAPPLTTTNASGIASVGWTLGTTPGSNNQGLSASSVGLTGSPVAFVASVPASPTRLSMASGDSQTGAAGDRLAQPFVVLVQDASNVPVSGMTVSWQVTAGGGSLTAATSVTDASGEASTMLRVGTSVGVDNQTVEAALAGLSGSPVQFTASVVPNYGGQIVKISGDGQMGTAGTLLAQPIVVEVRDDFGNPVAAGETVYWAASTGSGQTSATQSLTNASGRTSMGWTLGTVAGIPSHKVYVGINNAWTNPVSFTAIATAGPAAVLAVSSGDNQSATAGSPLPAPLVVSVKDQFMNPVSGVTVNWATATGGGSVSSPTSATSASGLATVSWSVGATIGAQTTTAAVAGTTPAMVTFNATATAGP